MLMEPNEQYLLTPTSLEADLDQRFLMAPTEEVKLVQRIADVIGSQRVVSWLQTALPALDGRAPKELIDSPQGRQQIEDVLVGIEHGVY
jgi:uncharacterized protein (DUF2384 family)